jgi:hypothetical protein
MIKVSVILVRAPDAGVTVFRERIAVWLRKSKSALSQRRCPDAAINAFARLIRQ